MYVKDTINTNRQLQKKQELLSFVLFKKNYNHPCEGHITNQVELIRN